MTTEVVDTAVRPLRVQVLFRGSGRASEVHEMLAVPRAEDGMWLTDGSDGPALATVEEVVWLIGDSRADVAVHVSIPECPVHQSVGAGFGGADVAEPHAEGS
ncbi:hypothetical protein [Nocardioides pakistanensis]